MLSSLGIAGTALRWFESYLTGRYFRFAWGVTSAGYRFSQGSVLGPLLFSSNRHMGFPAITMLMTRIATSHLNQMIQRYLLGSQMELLIFPATTRISTVYHSAMLTYDNSIGQES